MRSLSTLCFKRKYATTSPIRAPVDPWQNSHSAYWERELVAEVGWNHLWISNHLPWPQSTLWEVEICFLFFIFSIFKNNFGFHKSELFVLWGWRRLSVWRKTFSFWFNLVSDWPGYSASDHFVLIWLCSSHLKTSLWSGALKNGTLALHFMIVDSINLIPVPFWPKNRLETRKRFAVTLKDLKQVFVVEDQECQVSGIVKAEP